VPGPVSGAGVIPPVRAVFALACCPDGALAPIREENAIPPDGMPDGVRSSVRQKIR